MTRQRKKQIENKAKGICVRCGKRQSITKLHCPICRIKVNQLATQQRRRSMVRFKAFPMLKMDRTVAQFMKTDSYLVDMVREQYKDYERIPNMLTLAKLQYTINEICVVSGGEMILTNKGE